MVHHPLRDYRQTMAKLDGLAAIADSANTDTAWDNFANLSRLLGFGYAGIGIVSENGAASGINLDYASTFFLKSFLRYKDQRLHVVDPAAQILAKGAPLVFADDACRSAGPKMQGGAARMSAFFADENISAHAAMRIDLPNRLGAGFLAFGVKDKVTNRTFKENVRQHLNVLRLGGIAYSAVALRANDSLNDDILTVREAQVLTLVAQGLTVQEIAEQEGRAIITIRQQLAHARMRLGARTTPHAVMLAQRLGAIRSGN